MSNSSPMHKSNRSRVIGVLGSGTEEHADLAVPLGVWIADRGFDLLTGGGGGVMAAISRGFHETPGRQGACIGILPAGPPPGYPNPWVEVAIHTHLPQRGAEGTGELSRSHLITLSSYVLIALPGSAGTRSEVELARRYQRPLIAYLGERGTIEGISRTQLPAVAVRLVEVEEFIGKYCRG